MWDASGEWRKGSVERPRLVLSRCLELAACRYDGAGIPSRVVRLLMDHVELVPVCPEVRIGLGVPRAPIRIEGAVGAARLVQPSTGRDLTDRMASFSHAFADATADVDGMLLKSRSPSCGVTDVKIYADATPRTTQGTGMFARVMVERHPWVAIEDEDRLEDEMVRRRWAVRVWASARVREAVEAGPEPLAVFHARCAPVRRQAPSAVRRALDRLMEEGGGAALSSEAGARYRGLFMRALAEAEDPEAAVREGGLEPFPREILNEPGPDGPGS